MPREITEPTVDEYGNDTHPAFGVISASLMSNTPGEVLFDSDILHGRTVRIEVQGAIRDRRGGHDYIHGRGSALVEVEMSQAQWASFVSSMNTTGVPCTVRRTQTDWKIPGLAFAPRLAVSLGEVTSAADRLMADIKAARDEYEQAIADKAGAKVIAEKRRALHYVIENGEPNITYASKKLAEHTENVVQKARADIEAMVMQKAAQLGLTAEQARGLVELPAVGDEPAEIEA